MAYNSRVFDAPADAVFAVLTDPYSYPDWLVGASDVRDVDDHWPEPGSRFHHRVGLGPLAVPDSTKVCVVEPNRLLTLAVRARPFVSAVAVFRIVDAGERCVVSLEEELSNKVIANVARPIVDPLTHLRNHVSLKRLQRVVAQRVPATS